MSDFVSPLKNRFRYSPDLFDFSDKKDIILFVFDDYMEHLKGSKLFSSDKYLGRGRTMSNNFRMDIIGDTPYVTKNNYDCTRIILGDVYAISALSLIRYDAINRNTKETKRTRYFIELLDQRQNKKFTPTLEAWMYLRQDTVTAFKSYSMMITDKFFKTGENTGLMSHFYNPL